MKLFSSLLVLICLVPTSYAQKLREHLNEMGLKGNVKEVVEYTYRGEINQTDIDTLHKPDKTITKFDKNGYKTEIVMDGNFMKGKLIFDYSQSKAIIESQFDVRGNLRDKYIYKYDDRGNKIEFDSYYGVGLNSLIKIIYKYDENNNLIEQEQINEQYNFYNRTVYLHNGKNQIVETHLYQGKDDDKFSRTISKYDQAGNEISSESFNDAGVLLRSYVNGYGNFDKNDNWLKRVSEDKGHSQMQGDYLFKNITKRIITYY